MNKAIEYRIQWKEEWKYRVNNTAEKINDAGTPEGRKRVLQEDVTFFIEAFLSQAETATKEDERKNVVEQFLPGLPELSVFKIAQRVHSSQCCSHKGTCLNQKEALELIHNIPVTLPVPNQSSKKDEK